MSPSSQTAQNDQAPIRTVGIIGAGFAGLSTAKLLKSLGYSVTVYEKEPDIGGVWSASRRYPGLTTQNPRDTYALSDFPMPRDYPEWPNGEQMQAYFEAYADRFDLHRHISLGCSVERAEPLPDGVGWRIHWQAGAESGEDEFDFLLICNGIFSTPALPDFNGLEAWCQGGGTLLHSSQFSNPALADGKHVLVIGYGKSSCDVAMAVAERSASTTVVARHLLWKIPKKILGVLNYKNLLLTRLGEGLFPYIRLRGADRFLHGSGKPLRNGLLWSLERVIGAQLRLRRLGLHPGKPLETIARSTVSNATPGFSEAVDAGTIAVKAGTQIETLEPGWAQLADGTRLRADLIVAGTGWHQTVPFLSDEIKARLTDDRGNFRLFRSMLPVDVPRLAFNGYNSSFFSQLNCEVGAMWLAEYLRGAITLPSREARLREIDARLAWMEARTDGKHARGTNIIPFSIHQIDELLEEIDMQVGFGTRLKQWFRAVDPRVYAACYDTLARRHARPTPPT